MKKLLILCLILVFCFAGCQQSGNSGADGSASSEPSGSVDSVCVHPEAEVGGYPKYVYGYDYGGYCHDPVRVYLTCQACGEEVISGTYKSDIECYVGSGNETIIREASCAEAGKAEGNCAKCGKLKQWEIPALEHEYLWYYGDDTPSCKGCGITLAVCAHEYEQTNDVAYTDKQAGMRSYKCKLCGDAYSVYYDQYGDYDVQTVLDTVCQEAQKFGWTVILDYNLSVGDELDHQNSSYTYRDAKSTEAAKLLTDAGLELLDVLNQNFYAPDNDRSDYYLIVTVDISRKANLGTTYLNIDLYVRSAD